MNSTSGSEPISPFVIRAAVERERRRSRLHLFIGVPLALVLGAALGVFGLRFAHERGWLNAASRAESHSYVTASATPSDLNAALDRQIALRRRLKELLAVAPDNARIIWRVLQDSGDGILTGTMITAADSAGAPVRGNVFAWAHEPAWDSCALAVRRDLPAIRAAAAHAGLSPRLVALPAICEQLRRAESFRETYKRFFSRFIPTGNLSMGVTGLKPETLRQMAPYFPAADRAALDSLSDTALVARLKSPDHSWSYLYAALCLSAIRTRWAASGVDLSRRPEIVMTVYNLGSGRCPPRNDPQAGGAIFRLGDKTYTFGSFAWEFYWSGILYPELPF